MLIYSPLPICTKHDFVTATCYCYMTASVSLSQLVQVYFDQFEACSSIKSSVGQNCLNTFTVLSMAPLQLNWPIKSKNNERSTMWFRVQMLNLTTLPPDSRRRRHKFFFYEDQKAIKTSKRLCKWQLYGAQHHNRLLTPDNSNMLLTQTILYFPLCVML